MMSSSSSASMAARRTKERTSSVAVAGGGGGVGGKVGAASLKQPTKALTPISEKENPGSCRRSTGKENPRSVSNSRNLGTCQKPSIRSLPVPRIEKPVGGKDGEQTSKVMRWSTSSVPRGRSSSPSDFTRGISDFRKERMPRVSVSTDRSVKTLERSSVSGTGNGGNGGNGIVLSNGWKSVNGFKILDRSQNKKPNLGSNSKVGNEGMQNGFKGLGESKYVNGESLSSGRSTERNLNVKKSTESNLNGVTALCDIRKEGNLKMDLKRSYVEDVSGALDGCRDKSYIDMDVKIKSSDVLSGVKVTEICNDRGFLVSDSEGKVEQSANASKVLEKSSGGTGYLASKSSGSKTFTTSRISESSKVKGTSDNDKGVRVANKYPSKLHEKLAYLEGKVKRIASDIEKTKEMLDLNNPDESITMFADIQDKISGIEKEMVHEIDENKESSVSSKTAGKDLLAKDLETSQAKQVSHIRNSVKGLNHEELEARLFPHHKLLRSRVSLSTSSVSSQTDNSHDPEPSSNLKPAEVPLSPIDDNPIALEFLASLHRDQPKGSESNANVDLEFCKIQEMDDADTSEVQDNSNMLVPVNTEEEVKLTADEVIGDFNDQENRPARVDIEEIEDSPVDQLNVIGCKNATGGWFVSEGESVLLAHDDGSCSFYDITNSEEKAEYKPPAGLSPNLWGDCWVIRAAGADGCSGRYVVAASSGNALESGFCSWDFYTKDVQAFHIEDKTITSARTVLGPLPNIGLYRRSTSTTIMIPENRQWWYKPCGPLILSTSSSQKVVKAYDIRDGEQVLQWEVQRPVITMDYSSPLHWRNRGKVVIAEAEAISLWDVNSLTPQALLSVSSSGRRVSALHVNNTDAELGGGVRRRVSSSEVEGNDGVFCTQDSINVLDFRLPSGVGLKISKHGPSVQSIFSRGDSVFLGCTSCTDGRLSVKGQASSHIQHFSLRKGKLVCTYAPPESNAHFHFAAISQVWGNSDLVMGVSPLGLFVFDTLQDEGASSLAADLVKTQQIKDIIGPDDMYSPSFDYLGSRILVISRDRPAFWRYL